MAIDFAPFWRAEPGPKVGSSFCIQPKSRRPFLNSFHTQFEPLLSAEEAAEHLRVHVKTLQKLARERRVPSVRMGKYWRFRLSALDQWVTGQQESMQPAVTA